MLKKILLIVMIPLSVVSKENSIHDPVVFSENVNKTENVQTQMPQLNLQSIEYEDVYNISVHIINQQCENGGFGWPHDDCSATFHNLTSPILKGIYKAWLVSQNSYEDNVIYETAMINGGEYAMTYQFENGESRFNMETASFMMDLSRATNDDSYIEFVDTHFFDTLESGTYGPDDWSSQDLTSWIFTIRQGSWVNIIPWEFRSLPYVAFERGYINQSNQYTQAILDGFNLMDNTSPDTVYSDVIGIAGGLFALASVNKQNFAAISTPNHPVNGITNLEELADYLVSLQNEDGSWYWHSNLQTPDESDKDTQTAAYAVLALIEVNAILPKDYTNSINLAREWLHSMRTESDGFASYPGGDENTEIEAEVLSALTTNIQPYPGEDMIFINTFE